MSNRSDNFNRTDTTTNIGTPSDGGSAWVQQSGTWGISTNQGYDSDSGPQKTCVLEASSADVAVQVTVTVFSANVGLILRAADDSNYLLLSLTNGGAGIEIYKNVSGSFTLLQTIGNSIASADIFKFQAVGTTCKVYKNAVQIGSDQDVTGIGQTNTKHGLRTHNDATSRFDDFSITDMSVVIVVEEEEGLLFLPRVYW